MIASKLAAITYASLCFYLALVGKPAELAGFAVAGAIALVFFDLKSFVEFGGAGFFAKIKQVREKVDDVEKNLAPILLKETDPDAETEIDKPSDSEYGLVDNSKYVLQAVTNRKYSWRTLSGIVKDTGIESSEVEDILHELEERKLVNTSKSSSGKTIWGGTLLGYIVNAYESK